MKLRTRIKLLMLAFSKKYDYIHLFTLQLKDKRDDGKFNILIETYFDNRGKIQNSLEIIKTYIEKLLKQNEK